MPTACTTCGSPVGDLDTHCQNCGALNPRYLGEQSAEVAPTTPAGWYDDPDRPSMQRYWDGSQWLDHWQPKPALPPLPPGAGFAGRFRPLSSGLTGALVGFLWAASALNLITGALFVAYWGAIRDWTDGGPSLFVPASVRDAETAAIGWSGITFLAGLVVVVLFLIWHNQSYKSAASLQQNLRWSSGWAVGGWFIPFANLVIPKLVMNEVETGAEIRESVRTPGSTPGSLSGLGVWWWGTLVLAVVITFVGGFLQGYEENMLDAPYFDDGVLFVAVGFVIYGLSAALAAVYVRGIGRRLA